MNNAGAKGTGWLSLLWGALKSIWGSIPERSKEKIIESFVDGFTGVLGAFFDRVTKGARSDGGNTAKGEAAA